MCLLAGAAPLWGARMAGAAGGGPVVARTLNTLNIVFACRWCTALRCRNGRCGGRRPRISSHPGYPHYCACLQVLHRSEAKNGRCGLRRPSSSSHPGYPHYCVCLQVLHRSEIQEWQVRLEETQEKLPPWIPSLMCLLAGAAPLWGAGVAGAAGGGPAVARTLDTLMTMFSCRCCTGLRCRNGRCGLRRPRRRLEPWTHSIPG